MDRRLVSFSIIILLTLTSGLSLKLQTARAQPSFQVYIRADGSVDPPDAPISTFDNVTYTLTDNITSSSNAIMVERSNIVVDGASYSIQGIGSTGAAGFCLSGIENVTIKNTKITGFDFSVFLNSTSNNVLSGNDITPGEFTGAAVDLNNASNNLLSGNNGSFNIVLDHSSNNIIIENGKVDVSMGYSSNNSILENEIERGAWGISLYYSSNNTIIGNNITDRAWGIKILYSSNNSILRNNITQSHVLGVLLQSSSNNILGNNSIACYNGGNFGVEGEVPEHFTNDIDATNTVDGRPVYYWVNEQDRNVPLDAGYVALVNCTNITAKDLNLTNNLECILLACTTNSTVTQNHITDAGVGIRLYYSSDNSFSENDIMTSQCGVGFYFNSNNNLAFGNNITSNGGIEVGDSSNNSLYRNNIGASSGYGVWVNSSSNICISENNITGSSSEGICVENSSNNAICGNNITKNRGGIWLERSSYNSISGNNITSNFDGISIANSSSNIIAGNDITNNSLSAILIELSSNNLIYHNNFIDNTIQVESYFTTGVWDNGVEGNYWSDYGGYYGNNDGIGDSNYTIDADNNDRYPLMGMFHSYNVTWIDSGYIVDLISNSTISAFDVGFGIEHPEDRIITFKVTGTSDTAGFCRICIPTALMHGTYRVFVNGTEILPPPEPLPGSNSTHNYLYFNYPHSTQEVIVVPEFRSSFILPLLMMATLLAVIAYMKRQQSFSPRRS